MRNFLTASLIAPALLARTVPTSAQPVIHEVQVGFPSGGTPPQAGRLTYYKAGRWTPLFVRVSGAPGGRLVVETSDSDDVRNRYTVRLPTAKSDAPRTFPTYTKPGSLGAEIVVTAQDPGGPKARYAGEKDFEALDFTKQLFLTVGSPLPELPAAILALEKDPSKARTRYVAAADRVSRLPDRWFGYEGVDLITLTTGNTAFLKNLLADRRGRKQALGDWVRHGGRLIISVAPRNRRRVADLLASWRPAVPGVLTRRVVAVDRLEGLVQFAEAHGKPFEPTVEDQTVEVVRLQTHTPAVGPVEILAPDGDHPLLVRFPYGAGSISLVAIDLAEEPFTSWQGRGEFWQRLVAKLGPSVTPAGGASGSLSGADVNDLATDLQKELEVFPDIRPVSFGLVAFLIFLYILVVGPLDYLFLKTVVKRFQYTWITFPVVVVVVTAAAFVTAGGQRGREFEVNKVDVLDVDQLGPQPSATGTTWFTLYSPDIRSYTVGLEPGQPLWPAAGGKGGRPPVVLSGTGRPESGGLGSTGRGSVQTIYRGHYDYAPDAAGLSGVPLPFASTRSFVARWSSTLPRVLDARLVYNPGNPERIFGKVVNRLPVELQDAALLYGGKWYTFARPLVPGRRVAVSGQDPRDFGDWHNVRLKRVRAPDHSFDATAFVKAALFYDNLTRGEHRRNNLLGYLDQSWRLRELNSREVSTQEALVVGRLARAQGPAEEVGRGKSAPSRLWLGALPGSGQTRPPLPGTMTQDTYLRIALPVRPSREQAAGD
jgi:hypothetical protein